MSAQSLKPIESNKEERTKKKHVREIFKDVTKKGKTELLPKIEQLLLIIVRMAKATKWLQAILGYMKKVKSITSTVFGQFS